MGLQNSKERARTGTGGRGPGQRRLSFLKRSDGPGGRTKMSMSNNSLPQALGQSDGPAQPTTTAKKMRDSRTRRSVSEADLRSRVTPLPALAYDDSPPAQPVFGVPLAEAARLAGGIPAPVGVAVEWLDRYGLSTVGLYRVPGSFDRIKRFMNWFNKGEKVEISEHEDPHVVAGILKTFLRDLPEIIFTEQYRPQFKQAADILNEDKRIAEIKALIGRIPQENQDVMRVIARHLHKLHANANVNKMTAANIAMVLNPGFPVVLSTIIVHVHRFWPEDDGATATSPSRQEMVASAPASSPLASNISSQLPSVVVSEACK